MKPSVFLPVLAAVVSAAAVSMDMDITDELDFKMGLRPRQNINAAANLQVFTAALGGVKASAITDSGDITQPFEVDGNKFNDFQTAANRACDNQHNQCANLANSKKQFSVNQCDQQSTQCKKTLSTATQTSFNALFSSNADFDFFCDT